MTKVTETILSLGVITIITLFAGSLIYYTTDWNPVLRVSDVFDNFNLFEELAEAALNHCVEKD